MTFLWERRVKGRTVSELEEWRNGPATARGRRSQRGSQGKQGYELEWRCLLRFPPAQNGISWKKPASLCQRKYKRPRKRQEIKLKIIFSPLRHSNSPRFSRKNLKLEDISPPLSSINSRFNLIRMHFSLFSNRIGPSAPLTLVGTSARSARRGRRWVTGSRSK